MGWWGRQGACMRRSVKVGDTAYRLGMEYPGGLGLDSSLDTGGVFKSLTTTSMRISKECKPISI